MDAFVINLYGYCQNKIRISALTIVMTRKSKYDSAQMSPKQLEIIRHALRHVRRIAAGIPGGASWSWRGLADEIDRFTDLTPRNDELDVELNDADEEKIQREYQRVIKNAQERMRQFVEGQPKGSDNRPVPEEPLFNYILEYLMHPDVKALTAEALFSPEINFMAAKVFSEFIWQSGPDSFDKAERLEGNFYTHCMYDNRWVTRYLVFSNSGNSLFAFADETFVDEATQRLVCRRKGWATFSPDSEIFMFCVDEPSEKVVTFSACISHTFHAENGFQIMLEGAPFGNLNETSMRLAQMHFNEDLPRESSNPHKFASSWGVGEKEKILFFKRIDEIPSTSKGKHGILDIGLKRPKWGSYRFSRVEPQTEESIMKETPKDEFNSIEANTPRLIKAIKSCNISDFKNYVESGDDVNCREQGTNLTPLHYVAILSRREEFEILKTRDDLDFLVRDNKGRLPSLRAALINDDQELADELHQLEFEQGAKQGIIPKMLEDHPSVGIVNE